MILETLLDSALRALILAAVIWIALRLLRVTSPRVEAIIWRVVLVAATTMPLLVAAVEVSMPALSIEPVAALRIDETVIAGDSFVTAVVLEAYALIALLLLARQLLGLVRGYLLLRRAERRDDSWAGDLDVRISDEISAPATFNSTILLPRAALSWSSSQREAVLAHEQTHVRHWDFLAQALAQLYRAAFWFSPLAWWLPKRLSLVAEYLCDDAAVSACADREAYARLLLEIARNPHRLEGVPGMAQGTIGQRIERILSVAGPIARLNATRRALLFSALAPTVTAAAGFSLVRFDEIIEPKAAGRLAHPVYPSDARRQSQEGTVLLNLYVLPDGSVADVKVFSSSGIPSLDASAAEKAREWQMQPGLVNGEPAAGWARIAVTFRLED